MTDDDEPAELKYTEVADGFPHPSSRWVAVTLPACVHGFGDSVA